MQQIQPVRWVDPEPVVPLGPPVPNALVSSGALGKRTQSSRLNEEVVILTNRARTLLWVLIVGIVLFNSFVCAVFSYVYLGNGTRDSLLWLYRIFFLFSDGNRFLMESSTSVGVGYAILSGVFAVFAGRFVSLSISKRRFRFHAATFRFSSSFSSQSRSSFTFRTPRYSRFTALLYAWKRAVGVRGPYFEVRLLIDEVFELTSQTVAAYSSSRSISNVYLNISYSIVIFLNSVCSVVFRFIFKNSLVKQRMACLLTDLVLDFIWGTLLPIWMYIPIVNIYLDRANVYNYIDSYSNASREIERVLILSWKSYALSIIPFTNALFNLAEIQSILREVSDNPAAAPSTAHTAPQRETVLRLRYSPAVRKHSVLSSIAHAVITLYGFGIVFVTLSANGVFTSRTAHTEFTCMHPVQPWFATKEACIGRQINCTAAGVLGTKSEMTQVFNLFDESSLSDLFIASCPGLEIPTTLHKFGRLQSVVISESTLNEWSAAASLDATHFSDLRTVNMNSMDFNADPLGLVQDSITESIEWIHLFGVDGTRLLDRVGKNWRHLLFFDCMYCGLTEFPEAMTHMYRLTMTSLSGNDISEIPEWPLLSELQLQAMWLGRNRKLQALPDGLWRQAATLGIFSVAWTNVSAIPEWLPDVAGPEFLLTAVGAAVCSPNYTLPEALQPLVACTA